MVANMQTWLIQFRPFSSLVQYTKAATPLCADTPTCYRHTRTRGLNCWALKLLAICLTVQAAWAQAPSADAIIRQQESQRRQEDLDRRRLDAEKIHPFTPPAQSQFEISSDFDLDAVITEITIEGVTIISESEIKEITTRYLGQTMRQLRLPLAQDLHNRYIKAGFGTIGLRAPQQDLNSGKLRLIVLEPHAEAAVLCKNGKPRRGFNTLFPLDRGQLFRLRAVEQGIENIDRLDSFAPLEDSDELVSSVDCAEQAKLTKPARSGAGGKASVVVVPGARYGYRVPVVSMYQPRPFWVSAGADDYGSQSTGRERFNAAFGVDDALGLFESFAVRTSHTADFANGADRARNLSGELSVPLGYWSFGFNGDYFDYRSTGSALNQTFVSTGNQTTFAMNVGRVLRRDQNSVLSMGVGVGVKETENFIDDVRLSGSSRTLTSFNSNVSYRAAIRNASIFASIGLAQGIDAFGSPTDAHLSRSDPHAQFTNLTASASVQYAFPLGGIGRPSDHITLRSYLFASWAPHALFGTEKIQVGGPFTVRGFSKISLSGDAGGFVRNEAIWYPRLPTNGAFCQLLTGLSLFAGLDGGWINRDYADGVQEQAILGSAIGARVSRRNLSFEGRVEKSITGPDPLASEGAIFRFMAGLQY